MGYSSVALKKILMKKKVEIKSHVKDKYLLYTKKE